MKLAELDLSLSLKLGDPVNIAGEDGQIFSWQDRLRYLQRAYSKVKRTLRKLMRNYCPEFAKASEYIYINLNGKDRLGKGILITDEKNNPVIIDEIKELFAYVEKEREPIISMPCERITSDKYLSVKNKINNYYTPSFVDKRIYYALLNNRIYLLPEGNKEIEYTALEIVLSKDSDLFYSVEEEVNIPNDYVDLLIVFAASEGMQDLGRSDKFQLYFADLNNYLVILKNYADLIEQKEGSEINDR